MFQNRHPFRQTLRAAGLGCIALLASSLADAAAPTAAPAGNPEAAFQTALDYTVKLRTLVEKPFAGDDKGAFEGAGFLVDRERRWLLTNAHVTTRSPSRVEGAFKGSGFFPVRKVYVDPYLDLAVLEIPNKKNLPERVTAANLECSNPPPVGHPVGAFGHPWSLSYTGTRGIVSGVAVRAGSEWLQTDAALNTGNSGGPLISLNNGRVVGINTAMLDMGNQERLNFAVPIQYACKILDLLRQGKDPSPPRLPVVFFENDNGQEQEQLKVAAAYPEADTLALREGDVIQQVAGYPGALHNPTQLLHALRGQLDNISLTVNRDGSPMTLQGRLPPVPSVLQRHGLYLSGLLIAPPGFRDESEANLGRLLAIHYVEDGSLASARGFEVWDLLKSVDGKPFHEVETLHAYLAQKTRPVRVVIKRLSDANDKLYEYHEYELPVENLGMVGGES